MGTKTEFLIERLGPNIVSFDLKFERANTQLATGSFYHLDHLAAQTP